MPINRMDYPTLDVEVGIVMSADSIHSDIKAHWKRILDFADIHFSARTEYQSYNDKRDVGELDYQSDYGSWDDLNDSDIEPNSWVIPKYASWSDYSGSIVEKSNVKAIHDAFPSDFEDGTDYMDVYGGHGTEAVALRVVSLLRPDCESLLELLEGLEDYPLADESLHSEMEIEAENEAWEDWARSDFQRELQKRLEAITKNYLSGPEQSDMEDAIDEALDNDQSFIDQLAYTLMGFGSICWLNEQGDSMYIDVEELLAEIDTPKYVALYNREDYSAKSRRELRDMLHSWYRKHVPRKLLRKAYKRRKRNINYQGAN